MRRVYCLSVSIVLIAWGLSIAGPFGSRNAPIVRHWTVPHDCRTTVAVVTSPQVLPNGNQDDCHTSPMPQSEFKGGARPAQAQSLPPVLTVPSTSQPPGTAGERRPDAGPDSLIGKLLPNPQIQVPPVDLGKLDLSKLPQPSVNISVPLSKGTSESIEQLTPRLHTSLTLIQAVLAGFGINLAGQWGALVVRGLQNFMSVWSAARKAASSTPLTESAEVIPGGVSTTRKRGT